MQLSADDKEALRRLAGRYSAIAHADVQNVMAAKPNPAFVASPRFDPALVEAEIARYCKACREHGTTLEFVLKDISTIANKPENLTQWAATVSATIDRYYS